MAIIKTVVSNLYNIINKLNNIVSDSIDINNILRLLHIK